MSAIRLTPIHAPAYRALMLDAYTRHPDAFTSSPEERAALPLSWWEERLADGDGAPQAVFACLHEGALVAVAGMAYEQREKLRHKASLFGAYVVERHRRRGLAAHVVEACLAHARSRGGVTVVQLSVSEGNAAALRLYERMGFAVYGREPCAVAVGSGYVTKLHLWRALGG